MKWHPSQIGKLMTNGRGKLEMGETAKSYIRQCAKETFYNYTTILIVTGKQIGRAHV